MREQRKVFQQSGCVKRICGHFRLPVMGALSNFMCNINIQPSKQMLDILTNSVFLLSLVLNWIDSLSVPSIGH